MIRSHLRSNAIGYVALFVALTAGAYAAGLPRDSVKSRQIKDGQVKLSDLAVGAVDGTKVADGSLTGEDFGGSLPQGPPGPQGPAGSPDSGADILSKLSSVDGSGSGLDADSLDGLGAGSYLKAGDPAGGDLAGNYPNPAIGTNAVGSAEVADGSLANADLAPREALIAPTLSNCVGAVPWSNGAAFALPASYWKDRSGVVHLQGGVGCTGGNATEGQAIFTLPPGYRPFGIGGPVVRWGALAGGVTIAQIAVLINGQVIYDGPNNDAADDYISLDGLTFRAET